MLKVTLQSTQGFIQKSTNERYKQNREARYPRFNLSLQNPLLYDALMIHISPALQTSWVKLQSEALTVNLWSIEKPGEHMKWQEQAQQNIPRIRTLYSPFPHSVKIEELWLEERRRHGLWFCLRLPQGACIGIQGGCDDVRSALPSG